MIDEISKPTTQLVAAFFSLQEYLSIYLSSLAKFHPSTSFVFVFFSLLLRFQNFPLPASSTPLATRWEPPSMPSVTYLSPSPTALVPVVLLTVLPMPWPVAPTTSPAVPRMPPVRLLTALLEAGGQSGEQV
jgi:hypothetical protein